MSTAVIYEGAPGVRMQTESVTIAGAPAEAIVDAALDLVGSGADRVELCGGLGPLPQVEVAAALGERASVGAVMYGFESLEATVDYKHRFEAGEATREAFVVLTPGSHARTEHGATTFVAVPDEDAAVDVAGELDAAGVTLIELYNGFGPSAVERVHHATGGRVAVGLAQRAVSDTLLR